MHGRHCGPGFAWAFGMRPENFGFDAVGVGDTNHNGTIDYLVSAASLDTVYLIDG